MSSNISRVNENTTPQEPPSHLSWEEFAEIIYTKYNRHFTEIDQVTGNKHTIAYHELDYSLKRKKIALLQSCIKTKLQCLFKEHCFPKYKMIMSLKRKLSSEEVTFLSTLYDIIEDGQQTTSFYREKDFWENITYSNRKLLISSLKRIVNNDDLVTIYFNSSDIFSIPQDVFQTISEKVLHPFHYRLKRNINQLHKFFNYSYDEIINTIGEEQLERFEKDFEKLLSKYQKITNCPKLTYPSSINKIKIQLEEDIIRSEAAYERAKTILK